MDPPGLTPGLLVAPARFTWEAREAGGPRASRRTYGDPRMRILAADLGATKTLLQFAEHAHGSWHVRAQRRCENAAYEDFDELVAAFLRLAAIASASGCRVCR